MLRHRPLVFIDVETTGASAYSSRILEIGAIRVENNAVVATMNQLVNPEEPVPSFITNLTGITNDHVWRQPTFKAVASQLEDMFSGALFVAHNVNFDYGFVREEFKRLGIAFSKDRLCTVRLSRALYPGQRSHRLDAVIAAHGYRVENRHRALDDAKVLHNFYSDHVEKHGLNLYKTIDKLITYAQVST